jgi:hypothetical protein
MSDNSNWFFLSDHNLQYAEAFKEWTFVANFASTCCPVYEILKEEPTCPMPIMVHKSKYPLFDVVPNQSNYKGFFTNQKLINCFEKLNLQPNRFSPWKIIHKGKTFENYGFWHHISLPDDAAIDFAKTKMGQRDSPEQRQFSSIDEMVDNSFSLIHNAEVHLTEVAKKFDMLRFRGLAGDFLISSRAAEIISAAKISGIQILPTAIIKS